MPKNKRHKKDITVLGSDIREIRKGKEKEWKGVGCDCV